MQKYKKSTKEEVIEMRKLWNAGYNLREIGKMINRHRTTVGYWIRSYKKHNNNKMLQKIPGTTAEEYLQIEKHEKEEYDKEIQRIEDSRSRCVFCKKEKIDPKWKRTHLCSKNCWVKSILQDHPTWSSEQHLLY